MRDISTLTEDDILAIPSDQPEHLFTGEPDDAKQEYRHLAKIWQPRLDKNVSKASEVMAHINVLYDLAVKKLVAGTWVIPGTITFTSIDGKKFRFKFKRHHKTELGNTYVGDSFVAYSVLKDGAEDLYEAGRKAILGLRYDSPKMESEMKKYMPAIHDEIITDESRVMIVKKTPDLLLLRDVLDHYSGKIEPRHVAWMISRMLNIACYLQFSGLTHNAISPDTVFISPEHHSCALLGGWWYAAPVGGRVTAVPTKVLALAPTDFLTSKVGDIRLTSELIKATGRELLGDVVGSGLVRDKNIPKPFVDWLRTAGSSNAFTEYAHWYDTVLPKAFGPRKFVELKLTASDIYKE